MAAFKRTEILNYNRSGAPISEDAIYWKKYKFPTTVKEYGNINSVEFSPVLPYNFAVSSSMKVQVYDSTNNRVSKSLSKFRETALCASFRSDGELLVAGGQDSIVRLFSLQTKSQLRVYRGHRRAIHNAKFLADLRTIASYSDDGTVRTWDIGSEKHLSTLEAHKDYVRCGAASINDPNLLVSASHDHTAKVWDVRTGEATISVDHGYPVEDVLLFPNNSLMVTAGGSVMRIWDILAGDRLLLQLSCHHKTITSLAFGSDYKRILSGSLDKHIKVFDVGSYNVIHTMEYPAPVTNFDLSQNDKVLVVGMTEGLLSIQHREEEVDEADKVSARERSDRTYQFQLKKGAHVHNDLVVHLEKPKNLPRYDHNMRKFQFTKALDCVLTPYFLRKRPEVVISVMRELQRRGGLRNALSGRQYDSLKKIVKFLARQLRQQRFARMSIDICNVLLDIYTPIVHSLPDSFVDLMKKLHESAAVELNHMKEMSRTVGAIESLLSLAAASKHTKKVKAQTIDQISKSEPVSNVNKS